MKNIFIIFVLLLSVNAWADSSLESPPVTKLGSFLSGKGHILTKDSYPVGGIREKGWAIFSALVVSGSNPQPVKIMGMSVQMVSPIHRTAFIDKDNLEALSKAIDYMIKVSSGWKDQKNESHKEITFSNDGYLWFGCNKRISEKPEMFVNIGVGTVTADWDQIEEVKKAVDKAIILLKDK